MKDTNDQHDTGERLAETVALLRIAGRVAQLGGWTIQLPSRVLTWSDETCAIHDLPAGYRPTLDEGLGYFPPEYRAQVIQHVETCIRDGTGYDFEVPKLTATGRRIWVRSIGEAVRDADGRIVGLQGAFQDITTRRLAEQALRESEAELRSLVAELETERARLISAQAVANIGSWETELATLATVWSAETHHIFETAAGDFHPTHARFLEAVHPEDRAAVEVAFARSRSDCSTGTIEHRLLMSDGRIKFVQERWQIVCDEQGAPARAIGTCQDITARRQLEQQYLRAQRMESIGTLAGGIAHDLNNVLAPILLSIGLLQEDERDTERLEILATIEASAKRGAGMVGRLLSFARGADGRREDVQVPSLVRDLATIVRDTFPKNIAFDDRLGPDLWSLQADPTQLHQVLLNLCVNARDAMPDGGQITVTAKNIVIDQAYADVNIDAQVGPYVALVVEDTGAGIPQEIIDKIFDPFFTTKDIGKGTGLGLATSLAIVTGHRGFMRVNSTPGTGTRFDVYLPAQTTRAKQALPVPVSTLPRGTGERVLVVDDEAGIRKIAKRTLEAFGYRVLLAGDGAEAIALYGQHQADIAVVLTDMMMPVMDGPATIQALVRLNPQVRIIAASGLATDARSAGPAGARVMLFLPKPYTAETLLQAIRTALR